jgi:hypothetical protein
MYTTLLTYFILLITTLTPSPSGETFRLAGTVISSATNKPIPHGTIEVSPEKGYKVNRSGKFTISGLTKGRHRLIFSAFGYEKKDTIIAIYDADVIDFRWPIYTECQRYSNQSALKDIKSKKAKLLLQGGIAPIIYSNDKAFSEKYSIGFYDFGCVAYDPQECLTAYNETIFQYLDKTYGKKWRTEIRKDVIGLRQ